MSAKKDLHATLGDVPLFSRCSKRELKAVARHTETVELGGGEQLIAEGAPGDALFVLLEGSADVTVGGATIRELGPGSYVGELALLDGEPRSATVCTTTPAVVAVLGRRMFRTLLHELPELAEQLLGAMAAELRQARSPAAQAATPAGDSAPESPGRA